MLPGSALSSEHMPYHQGKIFGPKKGEYYLGSSKDRRWMNSASVASHLFPKEPCSHAPHTHPGRTAEGPYSVLSEARPGAGLLQPALEERQQYSWECRRVWPGQESAKNPVGHKQTATMAKPTECLFFNKALKRQTLRLLGLGLNLHFCGFQ